MIWKNNKVVNAIRNEYEKIKTPTIFTITVLLACFFSIHTLNDQIGIVARLLFYCLVYVGAQNISDIVSELKKIYPSLFDKIVLFLICALATFCETGSYYLEPIYHNPIPLIPYFVLSAIWMSVIVLFLIYTGQKWLGKIQINESNGFSLCANIIMFVSCILLCMLCNHAFNPAITSADSQFCYNYALHLGETAISDGHPVFYLMLLRLCAMISPKIQFMIFVQVLYYSIVITYAMNTLVQIGVPKKVCICIYCLVGIGFNTIIQVSTLWKDIPFTISILWLTVLLIKMCSNQDKCAQNILWYVQFVISSILTALIRHNGLLPVIATIVLALILLKNKRRIGIASFIAVIIILFVKGPIYSKFQVEEVPGLKFYAMTNDIMYLYYNGGSDAVIMQVINDATDNDPDGFSYNPYHTDITRENMDHYTVPEFLSIYLHAWAHHPRTMLKGFLTRNTVIWSIDKPVGEVAKNINYLGESLNGLYQEQYPERIPNILTEKLTIIFEILTENHFIYMLYWRTAIYNLLMLIAIMLIIVRYRNKAVELSLPFLPIATNVFVLFVASGWAGYRYYWPSMLVACVVIPYALIVLSKKTHNY